MLHFYLPNLMPRCISLLNPLANGGSTGRAWLKVQGFGQKADVVLHNARIIDEHFHFSFKLGDIQV